MKAGSKRPAGTTNGAKSGTRATKTSTAKTAKVPAEATAATSAAFEAAASRARARLENERPATPEAKPTKPAPKASTVRMPISNTAEAPFTDETFMIRVDNAAGPSEFRGKVVSVYYGFTPRTKAEYLANSDVPWFNRQGEPTLEGCIEAKHVRRGARAALELPEIEVPAGHNLVFRLRFQKYTGGDAGDPNPPRFEGEAETMTYFVEA